MSLLAPRRAYERANSDDAGDATDTFEMISVYSKTDTNYNTPQEREPNQHLQDIPDQAPLVKPSTRARWFSGWRTGAYSAAGLALCSLVVNVVAAIWLHSHPDSDSNLVEVFKGHCDTVARVDTWVHLIINILSTLLLAVSNYCCNACAPRIGKKSIKHITKVVSWTSVSSVFEIYPALPSTKLLCGCY